MHTHTGGLWDIPNVDSESGKSKWLAKGNLEEMAHKSHSKCHKGVTQQLSFWAHTCVCLHVLYLFFPPNKHFVSLLSIFCGNSFLQSLRARAFVTDHWSTTRVASHSFESQMHRIERSPGEEHGKPLQYSCLENPQGQRSLASYSPWDCKELDTTEWLSTAQQSIIIAASEIMLIETWKYSREVDQINVRPVSHQL